MSVATATLLEGTLVIDLAGEPAAMTGRILADLGADVVKVETARGDPLRTVPPLGLDGVSLRYVAWNAGKRSLVVEGDHDAQLIEMLQGADVVVDTPGWPGAFGIDPVVAPQAVWVSVTPFGLTGPRAHWKASDLGVMASSGNMYSTGDPDRPPVRCTEPSGWAHVGPEAAMAALTALATGRPQRVDVSAQEAVMIASLGNAGRVARTGNRGRRSGAVIGATREIWPCADGFVSFGLRGGKARVANLRTITRLVEEAGLATPALTDRDWATYDHRVLPAHELDAIAAPVAAYFAERSMAELYEIAVETNLMVAPANSPRELLASQQLAAREFFGTVDGIDHFPRTFVKVTHPPAVAAPPSTARSDASAGAWEGTRIVELGTGAAGPIAVRYFAEHGATVIRVESRSRPDFLRMHTQRPDDPCGLDGSDMFDALNVGKHSVTLNLKHPEGVALARRLIGWADAVAENFAPRAMRGLGLDYASLAPDHPDLVMVSSCLQGQTGPHRDYPGFGGQGSALSGYNLLTGWPDREPVGPYGTITDSLAPRFVATALAAGLLDSRRTGRGVHLDVSQVEAAVYSLTPWVLDYVVNGHVGLRQGNRSDRFALHGVFACQGDDRWVAIACWDDADCERMARVMGVDVATEDLVAGWTEQRDAAAVADELQRVGVEAVPVADFADAAADPQLAHRGHFVELEHACMGPCGYERNGFRLSDAPAGYHRPSPLLGEHNEWVLGEILGIASRDRARLRDAGALT